MNEPSARAAFLFEYLDLAEATGDPAAGWEPFQILHLNNPSLFGIARKARQVGWSWLAAAEAVAESVLVARTPNIFVSVTQDEASEKIRYARQIIEALDVDVRPRLIIENRLELELQNGSRLISHPCRPVRGKARANVYLDEFAHYPKDREIYSAALPVTTKGGRLRIGSSPLGATGVFWEIYDQKIRPYPGYRRSIVPWWLVAALCRDVVEARKLAPHMLTEQRVRLFGTPRLIEIFENLPLEDFQQEYECAWIDESISWISWEEIKRNQELAQAEKHWYRHVTVTGGRPGEMDQALAAIDDAATAVREGKIETALAGGLDVGRKHNLSELGFVGKGTTTQMPLRLSISMANLEFEDQQAVIDHAVERLPVTKLLMDQNGLGMQLAENMMGRHGWRAEGVDFTNPNKELWAVELKVQFQRGNVPIPLERDLAYQIHSLRKKVTASKNAVFDTAANEQHHADKFWMLALAVWAAKSDSEAYGETVDGQQVSIGDGPY